MTRTSGMIKIATDNEVMLTVDGATDNGTPTRMSASANLPSSAGVETQATKGMARWMSAIERSPGNPLPRYFLADELRRHGDLNGWRQVVLSAFDCEHITHEQVYYRARAKVTLGDWSGWSDYDARCFGPFFRSQHTEFACEIKWSHKAWNGVEDLSNQTLFVLDEQGYGDTIQMLRYLPVVARMARTVIVGAKPKLVSLIQNNYGDVVKVWLHGVRQPLSFDQYAWSMSLPGLLGDLPPFRPLRAAKKGPPFVPPRDHVRAGICWAGSPSHPRDSERSMPIGAIAPLLARPDIEWISLQIGVHESESAEYPTLRQPERAPFSFADTAALISELDFVVAVDTAVAHLSGCLGVPTYLLLPIVATWRWGLGDTTPWYPTMRIIRQRYAGDWAAVIDTLGMILDEQACSPSGRLTLTSSQPFVQ